MWCNIDKKLHQLSNMDSVCVCVLESQIIQTFELQNNCHKLLTKLKKRLNLNTITNLTPKQRNKI